MNQNWLVTVFFFALLLVLLYGAFLILSPFLKAITWAAILGVLVYPLYVWLLDLLRGKATTAALIVIVMITLLVVLPGLRLAGFLSEEAVELVKSMRSMMDGEGMEQWRENPSVKEVLRFWNSITFELATLNINWKELLVQGAQLSSGFLVAQVKGIAQNVFLFAVNFIIALFTLFFFLRDGEVFFLRIRRLLPMDQEHQDRLFRNIVDSIFAVVHGALLVAMLQGLLAGLAYWALGIPFAVLWGVVTAFTALLPVGGSTLVSVPASIYLFVQGEMLKGFLLLAWSFGIVGTIDNLLKPMFIGSRLRLPMLFLFFGILGGLALFGALGLILGPVLFALLAALLDLYVEEYGRAKQG